MKLNEKHKAIKLRKRGDSITSIAQALGVSKGSVSLWVRDILLSKEILKQIKKRSHSAAAVEKRRQSRLSKENTKRKAIIAIAKNEVPKLTKHDLFLVGIALYWGEGSKKKRGVVEFTNSDPEMIQIMKKFFIKICGVQSGKFRGHLYIHEHLDALEAEKYWSGVSGIPLKQFHKTSIQKNRNKVKKDSLPMGTFAIVVCDTKLKLTIDGWMQGLYASA